MTRFIMIGGGGHARVLFEVLKARGLLVEGYVTRDAEAATGIINGIPRIGDDSALMARGAEGVMLVNGVGSVGDPKNRRMVFETYRAKGFKFASVIHPSATVASDALIAEGAQIMAAAVLQSGVRIGMNAIVNTGAIVDHDCVIGDHAHIATGACLSGGVNVGDASHVGAGATVIQNIHIGEKVLVAAGAVVVNDIGSGLRVLGNPARVTENI